MVYHFRANCSLTKRWNCEAIEAKIDLTMDATGYRERLRNAFQEAIARVNGPVGQS
jgi:hypothetical protein